MTTRRPDRYADVVAKLRERTRPGADAVARVRGRLDRALVSAGPELQAVPGPDAGAVARVKARLAQRPERRPAPVWIGVGAALALGATAMAGAFGLAAATADMRSASPDVRSAAHETAPEVRVLDGVGEARLARQRIRVTHDGQGSAMVTGDRVEFDWDYGQLDLDVPADLAVAVRTPEGAVDARGAALTVVRDALGTRFAVRHGEARAHCGTAPPVGTAGEVACDPVTAAGWLNRAHAHQDAGVLLDVVLADLDRGLALAAPADPLRGELWTVRANALLAGGRSGAALDAAESALVSGLDPVRTEALHRTAARLALIGGDCARAMPHLDALAALTPEEQAHRERCLPR